MTVVELQKILEECPDKSVHVVVFDQEMYGMKGRLIKATDAHLFDVGYLGNNSYTFNPQHGEPERVLIIQ